MDNKTIANLKQMPHLHKVASVCLRTKIDFALDLLPIAKAVKMPHLFKIFAFAQTKCVG